jgi:hypothetical protein
VVSKHLLGTGELLHRVLGQNAEVVGSIGSPPKLSRR